MRNPKLMCALGHVSVARRSLSLAASDLAVVRYRGALPVGDSAEELTKELERVCELAQELERCAAKLGGVVGVPD
jgi:hypothetical protein